MYEIRLSSHAVKFLAQHHEREDVILDRLRRLRENPFTRALDIKALQGRIGEYRLRVGGARVLYVLDRARQTILVLKIDLRGDVYKGR